MAYRTVLSFALALGLAGCQQLPESSDDDDGAAPATDASSTSDGSFLQFDTDSEGQGDENGSSVCDPVTQSGCGAGEKCTAQKVGASVLYVCVADTGIFDAFGSCTPALTTGDDGCPAAYACLGASTGGLCLPLCTSDADCAGGICRPDPYDFVPHCSNDCSPFEPSCQAPLQCRRRDARYACVLAREEDVGTDLSPCELADDAGCATGYACLPGELVPGCSEGNCCTPLCDLGGADPCPSPTTCTDVTETDVPGFEDIGACFVEA